MRIVRGLMLTGAMALAAACSEAQPPTGGGKGGGKGKDGGRAAGGGLSERMLAFDKDKDGKVTKAEVTDARLHPLFAQLDTNKDGVLDKAEMTALDAAAGLGGPGGREGGGPGGMGRGGPPQPGQVMPVFLREQLKLTNAQKKQLDELQKEVDAKLAKILTAEQKKQLEEMRTRGPGGPGGGPGGGPPGGGPGGGPPPS